jgi:flagellar basal body-associated protein FliL
METENTNYVQTIKKLKRKIWFLRIIILVIVLIIIGTSIAGYYYLKPYVEKANELYQSFQKIQPYLEQINQIS